MKRSHYGFTIVELLIVIVVIAILATITVSAFNGIQARADTASRLSEQKAWQKHFEAYYATYGKFPPYLGSPDGDSSGADYGWCLGSGFPVTGTDTTAPRGTGNCRDLDGNYYKFYVNTQLNDELRKVGSLPTGPRTPPGNNGRALGPYMKFYAGNAVDIANIFKGSTCPTGTTPGYYYASFDSITCIVRVGPY